LKKDWGTDSAPNAWYLQVAAMRLYLEQLMWRGQVFAERRATPGRVCIVGFLIGLMVMLLVGYLTGLLN
jgi:hypothetical protein